MQRTPNQLSTLSYSLILALSVTACGGGESSSVASTVPSSSSAPKTTTPTTPTVPTTPTTPTTPTPVNWSSSASAEEVFSETTTLQARQRRILQNVTVSAATMDAELIFASQYAGSVYIMPAGEAQKFANGSSFNYYPAYSLPAGKFGFKALDLPIGGYAVGVENTSAVSNTMRVELQRRPRMSGFHYRQDRFSPIAESLAPGARYTQSVTITSGSYRTVIDGANTGGTIYLIPQADVNRFLAGQTFNYYTNHPCGSGSAAPGFCELTYPSGTYAIAYVNDTSVQQALVVYGRDYVPD